MIAYNKLRRTLAFSDPLASQKYTYKFLEYSEKRNDSFHIALANYYLGNSYVANGSFEKALNYYFKAEKYFDRKKDSVRLSSILNGIGVAYQNNGNDSLSLKYFFLSRDISRARKDDRRSGIASNNISNIYKNRGDLKTAIKHLNDAVKDLNKPQFKNYFVQLSINLANAYAENNEYLKAMGIYQQMLTEVDTVNDILSYGATLRGMGNVYLSNNENIKAEKYLNKAFEKYTQKNFKDERYQTMMDLIGAYKANNNYKDALNLFYEYNTIKDSIFTSEKDKNLTEALTKFETEKKEKQLIKQKLLLEKENRQKNQIFFGMISLVVLLVLLYLFYRKRLKYQKTIASQTQSIQKQKIKDLQQKNKLLALNSMIEGQEAERLRIAKDLHDSLGGLLSTVKAHFTTIQKEFEQLEQLNITKKTNDLIDEACIEVRRISHNMMPHALSISGLEGAVTDLGEQLNEQGFRTSIEINNLPNNIEETKKVMIYRLIQEIISNINKHADAKSILIQLIGHNNELNLIIEDDGIGFDYNKAIKKDGMGLKSINSRVEFLDGTIDWDSQLNNGTSITINIPLS